LLELRGAGGDGAGGGRGARAFGLLDGDFDVGLADAGDGAEGTGGGFVKLGGNLGIGGGDFEVEAGDAVTGLEGADQAKRNDVPGEPGVFDAAEGGGESFRSRVQGGKR
jgi:hypothetical protein